MMIKDFHLSFGFRTCVNIALDQDSLSLEKKISCQSIELDGLMIRRTTVLYLKKLANK